MQTPTNYNRHGTKHETGGAGKIRLRQNNNRETMQ